MAVKPVLQPPWPKGDERSAALRDFLKAHLPETYGLAKGECVDFLGTRSGELDIIIYDKVRNRPLLEREGGDGILLAAEALLAAIEVKSRLDIDQIKSCYEASAKLAKLRPFGERWMSASEDAQLPRAFYSVVAYETNLAKEHWMEHEWRRFQEVAETLGCSTDSIDRALVLQRGLLNLPGKLGKKPSGDGSDVFHDWFLHLTNLLSRENDRRAIVRWDYYSALSRRGWTHLEMRQNRRETETDA